MKIVADSTKTALSGNVSEAYRGYCFCSDTRVANPGFLEFQVCIFFNGFTYVSFITFASRSIILTELGKL